MFGHIIAVDRHIHVRHIAARVEGDILQHLFKQRMQAARADILAGFVFLLRGLRQRVQRGFLKVQMHVIDGQQRLVLAGQRVIRLAQNRLEILAVSGFKFTRTGKRPCNSGMRSVTFATWNAPAAIKSM